MFEHGVASFDPSENSVLLWTRIASPSDVAWSVCTDPHMRNEVARGETRSSAQGIVVVDAQGLEAAATYFYAFSVGVETSPVGRTRTLPSGHVDSFRIAVASCARVNDTPLGVYRAIAEADVDLVLHVGDYIYESDGPRGGEIEPPAVSLDDYRRRYATVRSDPDCIAMHMRHPMVTVWDDGDLCDLAASDGAPGHDPSRHGDWNDRVHAAMKARSEWVPSRHLDPSAPRRAWGSVRIGDLAELLLLDTRLAGRDPQAGETGSKPHQSPDRSLLGADQRRWLYERLRSDDVRWAIVVSGVVVNEIALPIPAPDAMNDRLPPGYAYLDNKVMHDDQWDGYPAERDALAEVLSERLDTGRASLLLSGDVHGSWAFEGPVHPETDEPVSVEFTVPAVSSPTMEQTIAPGSHGSGRVVRRAVQQLPHVRHADLVHHGYGELTLTTEQATMVWWHVDPYARRPERQRRVGASLAVDAHSRPPELNDVPVPRTNELPPPRNPLPARPADLKTLRRQRRRRRQGIAAAVSTAIALAGLIASRRRRR